MANLVSPGYQRSVLINQVLPPLEERIITFQGLNRNKVIADGEMSDMWNLTSDDYPLLKQRKPRGRMRLPSSVVRPLRLMAKSEEIALIGKTASEVKFWFAGNLISEVDDLTESTTMVAINNKICFFPQKTYLIINPDGTVPSNAYGSLESSNEVNNLTVTITLQDARFTLPSGHGLSYDDAISIDGTISYGSTTEPFSTSLVIDDVDGNTIIVPSEVFINAIAEGVTSVSLTGTISRSVPHLDHVIEWNNRLWGCNSEDNTVYACKLGDPKNWDYFQGTSLDSYYAEQGTDGEWTGIAQYSNHLLCFKEQSICRVYGTAPSNYQVANVEAFGVEKGSRQSIAVINDTVFYKSRIGIMAYSGGTPYCISDKLNVEFREVVAGTEKRKYYASIKPKNADYELMVFDVAKGTWHKEDNERFRSCATIGDSLYFVRYDDDLLACSEQLPCSDWLHVGNGNVTGYVGIINTPRAYEDTETMYWRAVFGPFDEYIEEHKIYSKLAIRFATGGIVDNHITDEHLEGLLTEEGEVIGLPSWVKIYISIDEGEWEQVEFYEPAIKQGEFIPIIPRRCDRYSVKIEGSGHCEIKTLTRRVRRGTFGRL